MTDQLSAWDASFLELEQLDEGATMHIGGVMVFDPLPGGGAPGINEVCTEIASRREILAESRVRLGRCPMSAECSGRPAPYSSVRGRGSCWRSSSARGPSSTTLAWSGEDCSPSCLAHSCWCSLPPVAGSFTARARSAWPQPWLRQG